MTDIVERLRQGIDPLDIPEAEQIMDRAADEIERLRNTIKNCQPVSGSEYAQRLEAEIERRIMHMRRIVEDTS